MHPLDSRNIIEHIVSNHARHPSPIKIYTDLSWLCNTLNFSALRGPKSRTSEIPDSTLRFAIP